MNAHQVGPDPDARKVRLCLYVLIAGVVLLLAFGVGHADAAVPAGGACAGYTAEPAVVVAFRAGVFANVVTVRVGQNVYGTRYTLAHYEIGEAVHVSGIACEHTLQQFRMWR